MRLVNREERLHAVEERVVGPCAKIQTSLWDADDAVPREHDRIAEFPALKSTSLGLGLLVRERADLECLDVTVVEVEVVVVCPGGPPRMSTARQSGPPSTLHTMAAHTFCRRSCSASCSALLIVRGRIGRSLYEQVGPFQHQADDVEVTEASRSV